jgi:hypothetical protein
MLKWVLSVAAVAALIVPVAALAENGAPTPSSVANQICKNEQTSMGALFATTYGTNASRSNAFGQCVAKNAGAAQQDVTNAAKQCQTEQADANFAANHGGKTFDQYYGANTPSANGKGAANNAFGKCVAKYAGASAASQSKAATAAAKTCKAAKAADAAAFASKYGSTRAAFGKCVAAIAKSK